MHGRIQSVGLEVGSGEVPNFIPKFDFLIGFRPLYFGNPHKIKKIYNNIFIVENFSFAEQTVLSEPLGGGAWPMAPLWFLLCIYLLFRPLCFKSRLAAMGAGIVLKLGVEA